MNFYIIIIISENRVLPFLVMNCFIMYFGFSAVYFFDFLIPLNVRRGLSITNVNLAGGFPSK